MTTNTTDSKRSHQPQLLLISNDADIQPSWSLDEETRETGRRGLAKARAALHATRPLHLEVAA